MNLNKRLDRLESIKQNESNKPYMTLGELYEWQHTPEGKAELDKLYNENRHDESEQ